MPNTTPTLIIGASAAGLAAAACLKKAGKAFELLEAGPQVAGAWRSHYDRLHLHTPGSASGLPHFPMSRDYPKYPSRDQVVSYLEEYAAHFDIRPRYRQRARRVRRENERWITEPEHGEAWQSDRVIIATGSTNRPSRPRWPGEEHFSGEILHSSEYVNGDRWKGANVLVVGFGNSGGEIAIDLAERGARPTLSVRSAVNVIPRDVLGMPILALGIGLRYLPAKLADVLSAPMRAMTIGDITRYGLRKLPYGPIEQIRTTGKIPLLNIGTLELIKSGDIRVAPGIEAFENGQVRFSDGSRGEYAAVVAATGYRTGLETLLEDCRDILRKDGFPFASGRETLPGLWFCGFNISPSGMLREIGIEARRIAAKI